MAMDNTTNVQVALIIKGNIKRAATLKGELTAALSDNYKVVDKYTTRSSHATILTKQAIEEGAEFIIAAGGDGTVNEVVNGIMSVSDEQRNKVFLGILPLGTGNDFVRTTKISKSVPELAQLIKSKQHKIIDIGECRFANHKKVKINRYFNNIAEVGIGAQVVEIVSKSRKRLGGTMSFIKGVSKAFVSFKKPYVKIRSKNFNWSGKAVTVCFANGQYFGSGLGISPYSKLDDGKLNLVIAGDIKLVHFFSYLSKLRKLKPIKFKKIRYETITSCELTSKQPSPIEIDGENVGFTPLKVSIIPHAIKLLTKTGG